MATDSTGIAIVDLGYHWRPIDEHTPRGRKLQLIRKSAGIPQYAKLNAKDDWFDYWCPLPTFAKSKGHVLP